MTRRWAATFLATLALALSGCTAGSAPSAEPVPSTADSAVGGTAAKSSLPGVQPGAPGLSSVTYDSTMEIDRTGLYFVNGTTGKVEGWRLTDQTPEEPGSLRLSEDGLWVMAQTRDQVQWVNRSTGAGYHWAQGTLRFLGPGGGRLLFQELKNQLPTGTFYVVDEAFQLLQEFSLGSGTDQALAVRFSPDGKRLAVALWRSEAGSQGMGSVHLLDLDTGESRVVDQQSPAGEAFPVSADLLGADAPEELIVAYHMQQSEPSGLVRVRSIVRRFDWQGDPLGGYEVEGTPTRLSPDGRLLLSHQELDHLAPAALVTDAATGEPRFRVAGASGEEWLSDGSALLVNSGHGYQLASLSAELQPVLSIPATEGWTALPSMEPAPDNPALFAYGLAVFDGDGALVREVKLPRRDDWLVWGAVWGASADELVIAITPPIGKGNPGMAPVLPVQVQEPPFADPYLLQVQDPEGECLNLRAEASAAGKVIRCLPTGTQLGVGDFLLAPVKLNTAIYWAGDQQWLWVRTEQGETGWVSASAGALTWAQ